MRVILIAYLWPGVHNRADKCFENHIHEVFRSCFYPKVPPKVPVLMIPQARQAKWQEPLSASNRIEIGS